MSYYPSTSFSIVSCHSSIDFLQFLHETLHKNLVDDYLFRSPYYAAESWLAISTQSARVKEKIHLEIGVHLGDVIHRNNDVLGNAVNVASRIEPLCAPGSVCVTEQVYSQVRNKLNMRFSSLGKKKLKNVEIPIEVYRLSLKHPKSV